MNTRSITIPSQYVQFPFSWKGLAGLAVLALLLFAGPVRAQETDDDYLIVYGLIQDGDTLSSNGKLGPALAKYREAQVALDRFQRDNPSWNAKVIKFRARYLGEQVTKLSENVSKVARTVATNAPETPLEAEAGSSAPLQKVTLLEPGAEPRKALRLHPNPGDKQTLTMTMKMGMQIKVAGVEAPAMKVPPVKMSMDVTIMNVAADGDISYEMIMGDAGSRDAPDLTPQDAASLNAIMASFRGASFTGLISNRGLNKGVAIKLPPGADAQTRQLMDQMKDSFIVASPPLPEEAIGLGAKWEVKMPVKSQGMTIDQTSIYQLVSMDGERLTARSTVAQHAANQKIHMPSMPGMKLELTKMVGNGTTEATFNLTQLMPPTATVDSHAEISMGMDASAGSPIQGMDAVVDVNLRLEAK
jgi:hypothetical protein